MNKIKVVISGLIFPFTMLHLFWRAFERREDVDLFVTGPFTGDWIPWMYGIRLPQKYVKMPNFPLPATSRAVSSKIVETQLPWKPDLWLEIDAEFHFIDKPNATVVGHIHTDPHVLRGWYNQIKGRSDITFCMQNCYREQGEYYLPYAADPTIHYPMDLPKEHDCCLEGLQYDQRTRLVNFLRSRGKTVHYSTGAVYDEYRELYNKSRVALSWSSLQDTPSRVWEAMAMQIPLVTNRTPDLPTLFVEGDHYLGFDTIEEANHQVDKILSDPDFAAEMAHNAYRKVMAQHTWDIRCESILHTAKLI